MDEQEFNEARVADIGNGSKPIPAHYKAILGLHVLAIMNHVYAILPIITELGLSFTIEVDGVVVAIEKRQSEQEGMAEYEGA